MTDEEWLLILDLAGQGADISSCGIEDDARFTALLSKFAAFLCDQGIEVPF